MELQQYIETKLLSSFDYVRDILRINSSSIEMENSLLIQLTRFYDKHGRLNEFMRWAIINEVDATDAPDDLFRKGSIATGIMFNFLFSELGRSYLKSTVLPLIQKVEDLTEDIDVEEPLNASLVRDLLNLTSEFLNTLDDELASFPLHMREGFSVLEKEVATKFPSYDNAVGSLLLKRSL